MIPYAVRRLQGALSAVSSEFLGRGDAKRTLSLLWGRRPPPTRGRKPGLTIEAIVRAGIELADDDGLGALSMRRVADRLGVGTMSLYTYVPTKAELLELMVDAVYGEHAELTGAATARPDASAPRDDLRARLEAMARANWDLHLRHPWMLGVSQARSVLGPNEMALFEAALREVDGLGLTGREMVAIVDTISIFVRGAVRAAAEAREAPAATGQSDDEWWGEREPLLEEYDAFDAERFPTVMKVGADGGFDVGPDAVEYVLQFALDDFAFGLQRLLDGIEAFVASRTATRTVVSPARSPRRRAPR
jgi:AcrR family transcriptional regulator